MIQFKINEKPLSVNLAWQGKRFKTPAYKDYEKAMLLQMPPKKIDPNQMLRVEFFLALATRRATWTTQLSY
jgi:hypothetical protein